MKRSEEGLQLQLHVLDTTALSAAMRYEEALCRFLASRRPGEVATAPPAVAEIEYGIARLDPESRKRFLLQTEKERVLGTIAVLDWNRDAFERFGAFKAQLEQSGAMIDDFDIAIAAVAAAHGGVVVTANIVHFSRISGLDARHWEV